MSATGRTLLVLAAYFPVCWTARKLLFFPLRLLGPMLYPSVFQTGMRLLIETAFLTGLYLLLFSAAGLLREVPVARYLRNRRNALTAAGFAAGYRILDVTALYAASSLLHQLPLPELLASILTYGLSFAVLLGEFWLLWRLTSADVLPAGSHVRLFSGWKFYAGLGTATLAVVVCGVRSYLMWRSLELSPSGSLLGHLILAGGSNNSTTLLTWTHFACLLAVLPKPEEASPQPSLE